MFAAQAEDEPQWSSFGGRAERTSTYDVKVQKNVPCRSTFIVKSSQSAFM
jgi:hypothetical protein